MKTFGRIRAALEDGSLTLGELVDGYLAKAKERSNSGIYLEIFAEEAREKAVEIQAKIKDGTAGKLAGMVVALKDNICYKGHQVSAASKILDGFESVFSSTAVERLLAEDAIIIGRTNCDEFAMGSSNENSAFGPVKNPINESYVTGGSSGGSAAAVAAETCLVALGSDTGGSIRQPASFCGLVGVKPTYGRVSRHGLIAYASSFDQIGPFAHHVEDAARVLEVIAGKDPMDSTSSSKEITPFTKSNRDQKYHFAYIQEALDHPGLSEDVKAAFGKRLEQLKEAGHTLEAVNIDLLDAMVPTYYVLTTAEASSNLARYDGIHFGHRSKESAGVDGTYLKSRTEGFGPEVKRRILLGTFVLSSGYYDAYYTKAQKVRRRIQEQTQSIFQKYDALLSPTSPHGAFKLGEKSNDPIALYLEDIFTVQANLAGIPAMSVPMGVNRDGMPLGLQIAVNDFEEHKMFAIGSLIEEMD